MLIKKVRNSLSAKVFLWIAGILIFCSLLIYGIVMIFLPQSYMVVATNHVSGEITQLLEALSQTNYADADKVIEQFCQNNQALVVLGDGASNSVFGSINEESVERGEVLTSALEATFQDTNKIFTLNITAPVSAGRELTMAFLELLPLLLGIILLISTFGAFLCSRVLVKPVLEISRISSRMANLDMTWDCKVNRTDELGILANSLNTMSQKLDTAMKALEDANQKLREDMEHITQLSKQRRDFFAAASHELKTPITILKGQIESMILGVGRYKNAQKILPDTLKEVESIERLVKEILAISKIEMNGLTENTELVSVSVLLKKVLESLLPLAQEKNIIIKQNITEDVRVLGNPSLLEKALHNIVSNAIRHSPEGAEVSITLSSSKLLVQNTGVTIPSEDLPVLFTPFYRVEKSRNKATGGSGLGLYLVKTILELHGMKYGIENVENSVSFFVNFNSKN